MKNAQDDIRMKVEKYLMKTFPKAKKFVFDKDVPLNVCECYGFKSILVYVLELPQVIYYKY